MDYTDLYNFQTGSGMIVPSLADVKSGIEERFKEIFGSDLDVTAETPVGRLIEALTVVVQSAAGVTAQSANQFNVNFATGVYLDSLAQIYGLTRNEGTKTTVPVTLKLTSENVIVPSGSLIMNDNGDLFATDSSISGGPVSADGYSYGTGLATAVEFGPVPGEQGTITKVQNSVLGWVGVTNGTASKVGSYVETDAEFRERIKSSRPVGVGFQTHLVSMLQKIDGVKSVCVMENNNTDAKVQNGVVIPGHSIYVCVYGPTETTAHQKIADAIVQVKPAGTGMVHDPNIGIELIEIDHIGEAILNPQNVTKIYFYKAATDTIDVDIEVNTFGYSGDDLENDVKNAVIDYVYSVGVGSTVYGTMVASSVMSVNSSIAVKSVRMSNESRTQVNAGDITTSGMLKAITTAEHINVIY